MSEQTDEEPGETMLDAATHFEALAEELKVAAEHALTAARHLREGDPARAGAHAFALDGHVRTAGRSYDRLARMHAAKSVP